MVIGAFLALCNDYYNTITQPDGAYDYLHGR